MAKFSTLEHSKTMGNQQIHNFSTHGSTLDFSKLRSVLTSAVVRQRPLRCSVCKSQGSSDLLENE
jgi:hypothetical protein